MPKSVFFTLFDRKIAPVLLYVSEIWGFSKRESYIDMLANGICASVYMHQIWQSLVTVVGFLCRLRQSEGVLCTG